ncbi:MAG: NCS2 family permease [Treponema sp.]|nr:NCS2 family permease [Treponema sp.]
MENFFKLRERNTNVRTEFVAGLTTFFTMAYIMFVNPNILSATGMNWAGVFVATILATAIGTLIMGFFANVPYAVAPGMGLNAFFTYTVCFGFGFKWQEALAMVFICGLINILITATKVRKSIIKAIPRSLQLAIGGGIGLFIAYIGIKNAGFIQFASTTDMVTAGAAAVPELIHFNTPGPILAIIGLVIIVTLMLLKVKGALLIGIIAATLIGIPMGVTKLPEKLFDMSALAGFGDVSFAFFGSPGLGSLFGRGAAMIPIVLITIFSFSLSDTFDTIGTFIGTGRKTGIFDEEDEKALIESKGFKSRMDKALFADSTATSIGALFGTSNTTTYIESASGIGEGGRSGLTSVVVAVLFLLCLPLASLFGIVPSEATAPALIVVGIMMAEAFAEIQWKKIEEAVPAFFTVIIMTFAYNISYGIAAGFIFYCLAKLCRKEIKQVHPILIGATILFLLNFILVAINNI